MKALLIQREKLSDKLLGEMEPLFESHFNEVAHLDVLAPSIAEYKFLDASDKLRIYTARNGELVGYAVYIVHDHPHYGVKAATQTLLYLEPGAREGLQGLIFLKSVEEKLEKDGVKIIYQSSSEKRNITPLLKRIGHKKIEEMWGRRVS